MRHSTWTIALLTGLCLVVGSPAHPLQAQDPPPADRAPAPPGGTHPYQTRKDFAACTSREQLHQLMTQVAEGNSAAYRRMLADPKSGCFLLRPGIEVSPLGYNALYVELRPAGMRGSIWTVLEAIEPKPRAERQGS